MTNAEAVRECQDDAKKKRNAGKAEPRLGKSGNRGRGRLAREFVFLGFIRMIQGVPTMSLLNGAW